MASTPTCLPLASRGWRSWTARWERRRRSSHHRCGYDANRQSLFEESCVSIDRLPPQSVEAEQSVLGALLIDRDAVIEVAELLQPGDFYRQAHGQVYAAVLHLYERREPVDIVTVSEVLEREGQLDA